MFSNEAEELKMLPRDPVNSNDIIGLSDANEILEQYASWKSYRDKKLFGWNKIKFEFMEPIQYQMQRYFFQAFLPYKEEL